MRKALLATQIILPRFHQPNLNPISPPKSSTHLQAQGHLRNRPFSLRLPHDLADPRPPPSTSALTSRPLPKAKPATPDASAEA
eukprot:scaffold5471_cov95-Pinguiococcus_pyrenoidosus.AAC.1